MGNSRDSLGRRHLKFEMLPQNQSKNTMSLLEMPESSRYLEAHELLPFVRGLLQTVIRDRPSDPYTFISEQRLVMAMPCPTRR